MYLFRDPIKNSRMSLKNIGWLKHTEEPRKKIYLKRNLGQKSYYLLSIYKLPLFCHHLSSYPVSGRHIFRLPCLSSDGNVFILTKCRPFSALTTETSFRLNILLDQNQINFKMEKKKCETGGISMGPPCWRDQYRPSVVGENCYDFWTVLWSLVSPKRFATTSLLFP